MDEPPITFVRVSHRTVKLQEPQLYPIIHRLREGTAKTICGRRSCLVQFDEAQLDEMMMVEDDLKPCNVCFSPENSIHRKGMGTLRYMKLKSDELT